MKHRLPKGYAIHAMNREEASLLDDWAAGEGRNPGVNDIDVAWGVDPQAFIALRLGMDGVLDMMPFYERGGFEFLYRDLRYQGMAASRRDAAAVRLEDVDFARIDAYDRLHVEAPRTDFLLAWLAQGGGAGVALIDDGKFRGYGFLRPCRQGYKVGPAFADDATCGERLLHSLLSLVAGEQAQLDVPEPNETAVCLVGSMGWTRSFACARMVNGRKPDLPVKRIFVVTSFEFG